MPIAIAPPPRRTGSGHSEQVARSLFAARSRGRDVSAIHSLPGARQCPDGRETPSNHRVTVPVAAPRAGTRAPHPDPAMTDDQLRTGPGGCRSTPGQVTGVDNPVSATSCHCSGDNRGRFRMLPMPWADALLGGKRGHPRPQRIPRDGVWDTLHGVRTSGIQSSRRNCVQ